MASGTDYATSVGATMGAESGPGAKFGSSTAANSSAVTVAGTIGQDYYTSKIIYPEGIQVNPEDGSPMIVKSAAIARQDGDRTGVRY